MAQHQRQLALGQHALGHAAESLDHRLGVAANWLDGDFAANVPNRKWVGDITYVWTQEGWLYLAVILDLHSRRVVGWAVSDRMKKDLAAALANPAAS